MAKNEEFFCPFLTKQDDRNGDVAIVFCGHEENQEDTEGNCRKEICPLRINMILDKE